MWRTLFAVNVLLAGDAHSSTGGAQAGECKKKALRVVQARQQRARERGFYQWAGMCWMGLAAAIPADP